MVIYKAKDYQDMSRKAANIISAQIIMKPNCVLGLATGSSPVGTYKQLIEWYKKGDLDFSQVTYKNFKNKFKSELELINEKIEDASQKISNHKNFIDKSIAILQNTSKIWSEGDIENKIRIQKLVFPEGLSIKAKNRQYLTNKVNQLFVNFIFQNHKILKPKQIII